MSGGPLRPVAGARARCAWGALGLVGAVLWAYWPVLHAGFVFDDDAILTANALVHDPHGLRAIWFSTQAIDYWPVTLSSLWVEWHLWGLNPAPYHATNLVLHAAEVLLLWAVLRRLRVPGAWFGALLFAVHPVNVETVAWITQRKNLAALLFYLLSILAFLRTGLEEAPPPVRWLGRGGSGSSILEGVRPAWYALSLAGFALAMLGKGSVAPLPLVLLGLIAWRRRPVLRDAVLLLPFLAVAAVLTLVNIWFRTHGNPVAGVHASLLARLLGAGAAVAFYAGKALLPVGLSFVYPHWQVNPADPLWWLPLAAVCAATAVLWTGRGRPGWRAALFAWGYFVVCLIPVMGFADVGFMKFAPVADHYQHPALIGAAAALGALGARAWGRWAGSGAGRPLLAAGAVGLVAALGLQTRATCAVYHDEITLFQDTLRRVPDCWVASERLGVEFVARGRPGEALAAFREVLRQVPDHAEAHYNAGSILLESGRAPEAVAELEAAVRSDVTDPSAHYDLARAYVQLGRLDRAVGEYRNAIRLRPSLTTAYNNLAVTLERDGRPLEALEAYRTVLRMAPGFTDAQFNYALALIRLDRPADALVPLRAVLAARPDHAEAHWMLGRALTLTGDGPGGLEELRTAARLAPDNPGIRTDLGVAERAAAGF